MKQFRCRAFGNETCNQTYLTPACCSVLKRPCDQCLGTVQEPRTPKKIWFCIICHSLLFFSLPWWIEGMVSSSLSSKNIYRKGVRRLRHMFILVPIYVPNFVSSKCSFRKCKVSGYSWRLWHSSLLTSNCLWKLRSSPYHARIAEE